VKEKKVKVEKKALSNSRFDQNRMLLTTAEADHDQAKLTSASSYYTKKIFRNYTLNKNLTLAKMLFKETGLNLKTNIKISNRFLINHQLTDNFLMARVFKTLRSQQKALKSNADSSFNYRVCNSLIPANGDAIENGSCDLSTGGCLASTSTATDIHKKPSQKKLKNALSTFWRRGNLLRLLDFNFLLLL